jgi:hypothetical protein
MYEEKPEILEKVAAMRDNYALQSFLSELERCGSLDAALDRLGGIGERVPGADDLDRVAALVSEHFARPGKVAAAAVGKL